MDVKGLCQRSYLRLSPWLFVDRSHFGSDDDIYADEYHNNNEYVSRDDSIGINSDGYNSSRQNVGGHDNGDQNRFHFSWLHDSEVVVAVGLIFFQSFYISFYCH